MPASWRNDSSATGGSATAGDGGAIGVTVKQRDSTQRHFVGHLLPAQGLGVPCAPGINDRRVTHKVCCVIVPEAFLHDNGAAKLTIFFGASGLVPWRRCASGTTIFPDSPTLERSGMMASLRVSGSNLRQQAAKPSAGVSV